MNDTQQTTTHPTIDDQQTTNDIKAAQSEALPCCGRSDLMAHANGGPGAQTHALELGTGKALRCQGSYIFPTHIRNKYFRNTFVTLSHEKHASYNAQAI